MTDSNTHIPNAQPFDKAQGKYPITRPKRPFTVTLVIIAVLMLTVLGWIGLLDTLRSWEFLQSLPLTVPVMYIVLRNALLALIGPPLIWGLWVGRTWAWYALQVCAVLFVLVYWLDRTMIAYPAVMTERWPFAVGFTFFGLVCIFLVFWLPKGRRFFSN